MPIGYDYKCKKCGSESCVECYHLSFKFDGRDIFLPHTTESTVLKKYDYTQLQAEMEGRLFRNEAYACDACKRLFFMPSLELPKDMPPSRKSNVIFGIIIFPVIGYMTFCNYGTLLTLGICLPIVIAYVLIVSKLEKRRLHRRLIAEHSPPEINHCPHCGSDKIARLSSLHLDEGDAFPDKCSECGGHELVITGEWFS